jgi:hypothetical protein
MILKLTMIKLATIAVGVMVDVGMKRYGWDRHIWDVPREWVPGINPVYID